MRSSSEVVLCDLKLFITSTRRTAWHNLDSRVQHLVSADERDDVAGWGLLGCRENGAILLYHSVLREHHTYYVKRIYGVLSLLRATL